MLVIGIAIVVISITIYIIKNQDEFIKKVEILKQNKILRIMIYILVILVCIAVIIYFLKNIKLIKKNITLYTVSKQNRIFFKEFDEELKLEKNFYKEIITKEYGQIQKEPYMFEGFKYVEGDINSGYVIQDTNGNQYVWVPCTNREDENIVKLEKKDFDENVAIKYYNCLDSNYKEFLESTLKHGGFYISRFELGKENDKIVSKKDVEVLSNISIDNAMEKIDNMYNENEINCELINGYAYDTTLNWISQNNNIEIEKVEVKENIIYSGRNKYNNIYDFIDNIMEISSEKLYDTIIYRGFDYQKDIELDSRYNIPEDHIENYRSIYGFIPENMLAYRTVIYK